MPATINIPMISRTRWWARNICPTPCAGGATTAPTQRGREKLISERLRDLARAKARLRRQDGSGGPGEEGGPAGEQGK